MCVPINRLFGVKEIGEERRGGDWRRNRLE
jgi:hypothetical protein